MIYFNEKIFLKKIDELWGDNTCPMCGNDDWSTDGSLYTPTLLDDNAKLKIGKKMLPLIPITCSKCGNTLFINGKVLGCIEETDDSGDNK